MSVEVVRLREGINLKQLQDVIARYVGMKGCPACGLNGFDLRFEIDPRVRYQDLIRELDGVVTNIEVRPFDADQVNVGLAEVATVARRTVGSTVGNGTAGH